MPCADCDAPYCYLRWNVTESGYGYCPAARAWIRLVLSAPGPPARRLRRPVRHRTASRCRRRARRAGHHRRRPYPRRPRLPGRRLPAVVRGCRPDRGSRADRPHPAPANHRHTTADRPGRSPADASRLRRNTATPRHRWCPQACTADQCPLVRCGLGGDVHPSGYHPPAERVPSAVDATRTTRA